MRAQKTASSAMKATLKIDKGWVSANDLSAQSPLLRVTGKAKQTSLMKPTS